MLRSCVTITRLLTISFTEAHTSLEELFAEDPDPSAAKMKDWSAMLGIQHQQVYDYVLERQGDVHNLNMQYYADTTMLPSQRADTLYVRNFQEPLKKHPDGSALDC